MRIQSGYSAILPSRQQKTVRTDCSGNRFSLPVQDQVSLRFSGKSEQSTYKPDEYSAALEEVVRRLPEHLQSVIQDAIGQVTIGASLSDIIEGQGWDVLEELAPELIDYAHELREMLTTDDVEQMRMIAGSHNQSVFLALPARPLVIDGQPNPAIEEAVVISAPNGKIVLSEGLSLVLRIIKAMPLPSHQQLALASVILEEEHTPLSGYARAPHASEARSVQQKENEGLVGTSKSGDGQYTLLVNTQNFTASPEKVKESFMKILAHILMTELQLDTHQDIQKAFATDNRLRYPQKAIQKKLATTSDEITFPDLEKMAAAFMLGSTALNNPESDVGIQQAIQNCITHILFQVNEYDPYDQELVPQMYPGLLRAIDHELKQAHHRTVTDKPV